MEPDERTPTPPGPSLDRVWGHLQPGHACISPLKTLSTSSTPIKSPLTVPLTLPFPLDTPPLLCPLSSAPVGSKLRCVPT